MGLQERRIQGFQKCTNSSIKGVTSHFHFDLSQCIDVVQSKCTILFGRFAMDVALTSTPPAKMATNKEAHDPAELSNLSNQCQNHIVNIHLKKKNRQLNIIA